MTPEQIIQFENRVIESFKNKEILAPVHLDNGNENALCSIFSDFEIGSNDWVCGTWRSHAKCLLKEVPEDLLLQKIKEGKSMGLCFPEYKIVSSAIVGGIIPIATGLALSEKLNRTNNRVFCFIGDMTAETGIFEENVKYAKANKLELYFVVENNGKSVCTPTNKVWNKIKSTPTIFTDNEKNVKINPNYLYDNINKIIYFRYNSKYPHAGIGERITF